MKTLLRHLRSSIMAVLVLAVVCCGLYPLVVFGISQLLFRDKANGSLITDASGKIRGSHLLGQPFAAAKYFHPRPSAAGAGYDALSSSGSNLGPTSQKLFNTVSNLVIAYRAENGLKNSDPVPADAVTASGSGLDPHISVTNAMLQVSRVAKARSFPIDAVQGLVRQYASPRDLGVFGEPVVNVLELNLALDALK